MSRLIFSFIPVFVELFVHQTDILIFWEIFLFDFMDLFIKISLRFNRWAWVEWVVYIDIEVLELSKKTNFIYFKHVSFNEWVPKGRGIVGLEITKFFEESGYLNDDPEDILVWRMIVHAETFNGFIVLDDWVKSFFF